MKKLYLLLAVLVSAAPTATFAQKPDKAFDMHVASLRVLQRRDVQADMGVTTAQRAKMDKFADEYNSELKAYMAELQKDKKTDVQLPDQTTMMMLSKLKTNVMGILSDAQLKRLREISLQVYGLNGLLDEEIANKVGLSKEQVSKMQARYEQGSKQANDLIAKAMKPVNKQFKNAKPKNPKDEASMRQAYLDKSKSVMNSVMPDVQKIRTKTQSDILAMITPQQKAAFLTLQGKPFKPKD